MNLQIFFQKTIDWSLTSGLHILFVLILASIALVLAKKLSNRLIRFVARQKDDGEFQKRTQTLGTITRYVMDLVIIIVAP